MIVNDTIIVKRFLKYKNFSILETKSLRPTVMAIVCNCLKFFDLFHKLLNKCILQTTELKSVTIENVYTQLTSWTHLILEILWIQNKGVSKLSDSRNPSMKCIRRTDRQTDRQKKIRFILSSIIRNNTCLAILLNYCTWLNSQKFG